MVSHYGVVGLGVFHPSKLSFIVLSTPLTFIEEGNFAPLPQTTLGKVWKSFGLSQLGIKMLLASSGKRPGVTLNILQYRTAPSPHNRE